MWLSGNLFKQKIGVGKFFTRQDSFAILSIVAANFFLRDLDWFFFQRQKKQMTSRLQQTQLTTFCTVTGFKYY